SPSDGSLLVLSVVLLCVVLGWHPFARDPITLGRPVAEIPELASLRTKRAPGVSLPTSRLSANWAADEFRDRHHEASGYRLRASCKRVGALAEARRPKAPYQRKAAFPRRGTQRSAKRKPRSASGNTQSPTAIAQTNQWSSPIRPRRNSR